MDAPAPQPAPFTGGSLSGYIDLLAERADGATAVIDLKYGGSTHRQKELSDNIPLQLAVYARLLAAQSSGAWSTSSM